jgi:hypothetical protein
MPLIEKHGGLWLDDAADRRRQPIYERYDTTTDVLAVVVQSPSGHYVASVFKKVSDGQWRLPFWVECRPEALFSSQSDAVAHIEALLRSS